MEDLFRPFLVMVGFFMLDELLRSKFSLETGLFLLLMILMFPLFSWVSKRYRSFVWYKSGKKGFALLLLNFLFFLVLAPILIFFKDNLVNIILSIIISLVSLVGLFILGEIKYEKK
jgi:FlaA1/EpsC-like NDP-sugar epimerase